MDLIDGCLIEWMVDVVQALFALEDLLSPGCTEAGGEYNVQPREVAAKEKEDAVAAVAGSVPALCLPHLLLRGTDTGPTLLRALSGSD